MKKRIPVDIQFLLESILAENPDQVLLGNRAARSVSKGAKIKLNRVTADTNDAIPFYIDDTSSVVVFSQYNQIHGSMEYVLRLAARKAMADIDNNTTEFDKKFELKNMFGCVGLEYKSNTPTSDSSPKSNLDAHYSKTFIYFYGIKQNSLEGIKKYLIDNFEKLKKIQMRAIVDGKQGANELCGRVWVSNNVISFWNEKTKIDPYLDLVDKFMRQLDMNPNECVYEFIDGKNLFGHDDLEHDVSELEKISKEEIMNLLRTQHFSEKSKRELWNMLSPEEKNDAIKKHAKDFESPVRANAALPALEGHIKLKDLLKENPDKVDLKGGSDGDMKIARYQDSDAVAFFAFPNFGVYYEGGTHSDIINVLYNVYTELKLKISKYGDGLEIGKSLEDSYAFTKDYMMKSDVHVTNFDGMVRDMQSGPLKDFFDNENIHSDDDPGGFRIKSGGLSGRLWSRKKIISFWNVREDVIRKWNMIVQFFTQSAGKFGTIYEYKVDWLERDIRAMPMTPADEITSATGSEENQIDFLEKLSADAPPISPEELKELQKILHKLSPKKKKEALIKLGYRPNTKKSDIATKLGMTVAEFNYIMNINEEVS